MASRVPKLYQKQKKLNSLYYLKKAKQACSENSYAEAYEYFVNYFESLNDPSQSIEAVQTAFTKLVCKMGMVLEETDNIEELLKCYLQAINLFPNNYLILNNLGAYMFKIGEIDIARRYLELAVKVNKDYLPAEKNLLHVKWHQIPRWHFRMLNDRKRNAAYDKAISDTICEGYSNVIDIGAGCGLLSLLASRNPTASITAIEENKTLYKMCSDIFKENGVRNVNVLNSYSTDLTGPSCKCNLLVTEIFDVALFGERALECIYHALTVLRTEEDYRIIPCGAKLCVTGINSEELARKYWYIPSESLKELNLETMCIKQRDCDPYEAEYLLEKNVEYMTDTQGVFHLNFYDHNQIYSMLNDDKYYEIIHLKCRRGIIHALAVWFDLNLTEHITITTNPLNEDCVKCWEQAIFYLDHPVFMNEGEILTVKVTIVDCKLNFTVINGGSFRHNCFEVSKEVVSFMNDGNLVESIIKLANEFHNTNLMVIDYNVFPLFGLLMAKKNNIVYHTVKSDMDIQFFKHILTLNNIALEKFTLVDDKLTLIPNMGINEEVVYFFDPVNTDGSLDSVSYKERTEVDMAITIPQLVRVNVQLIYSSYIEHCNRVKDENVLGFKVEKFMNEYTGNEHPNLENFEYSEYSSPVTFTLEGDGEKRCDIVVHKNGLVNALYFWYDMQLYGDITFSTLNSRHFRKSCFFLDNPKSVKSGDICNIILKIEGSYLKLYLQ